MNVKRGWIGGEKKRGESGDRETDATTQSRKEMKVARMRLVSGSGDQRR